MVHLPRAAKVGLTVLFAIWRSTLNTVPVEKPISLSVGHTRETFAVNFTGTYRLEIEAERKLPHATLQCLLGIRDYIPEGQCKNIPPVLRFDWVLTEDGKTVKAGSSDSSVGGVFTDATVANQFAWLDGKRGHHYTIDLSVLQDGSELSIANPKLRIGVDESVYEGFIFLELITFGWAILGCLIGGVILLISFLRARKNKRGTPSLNC
ncbi:MAG: hypothetical protein WBV69_22965 [Candidatus Sulfotelmatobacter sp.]